MFRELETAHTRFQAELSSQAIESGSFKLISSQEVGWADILEIQYKNGSRYIIVRGGGSGVSIIKL